MHKKLIGTVILAPVFFIGFLTFPKPALAATQENDDSDKSRVMAEALAEAERQPSSADYKQKLGQVIVKTTEEELPREVDTFVRFIPKQDARGLSGSVGIIQSEFEYSHNFKAFGKLPVQFGVGTDYISIDNSTEVKLPAHLTDIVFGAEVTLPFFGLKNTYLRLGARPTFPTDNWRVTSSAFRMPSYGFAIYKPNPKLTLIAGVAVYPSNENKVGPIAGLIYQYNDKLLLNLVPPRPTVVYSVNDKLDVFAEGGFSRSEFQVKKDGYKKAVLAYNEIHMGAGLKYSLNKFIDVSLSAGGMFNRSLKYRDSLGKVTIKDGLYTEFRVESNF